MTKAQLNITNKSQEVSPFPAGDLKGAAEAGLSLHLSKCHIVRNHMSGLI